MECFIKDLLSITLSLGSIDNVQFTHEKVGHVIPKLYVVDKLFDGIEYLLGNNWMSESKVMVIPYLGIIMGVTPEQVTFMMGLRKTESSATEIYEKYCADKQPEAWRRSGARCSQIIRQPHQGLDSA